MKYSTSIDIHLPRERVIALFDDPANLKRWQPTLRSFERISGAPGQVGTRSRLRYKEGARETEMIETVTLRELPDRYSGSYELPGIWNQVDNRFDALAEEETRWTCDVEFRFANPLLRLFGWLMPGQFRKQTEKFMRQFKDFAENQSDEGLEKTRYSPS